MDAPYVCRKQTKSNDFIIFFHFFFRFTARMDLGFPFLLLSFQRLGNDRRTAQGTLVLSRISLLWHRKKLVKSDNDVSREKDEFLLREICLIPRYLNYFITQKMTQLCLLVSSTFRSLFEYLLIFVKNQGTNNANAM